MCQRLRIKAIRQGIFSQDGDRLLTECAWLTMMGLVSPQGRGELPSQGPSWSFKGRLKRVKVTAAATAANLCQSCLTLCDPLDGSPPGSPVPGILQARTLEWVAISFSDAGKWKVKVKSLSRVRLLATPWTAAYQAPPSMGFSRQEYWSGVPLPSPYTSNRQA